LKSVLQNIQPVGSKLTVDGLLASLSLADTVNDADLQHALERRWAQNLLKRANNNQPRAARLVGMPVLLFTQLLRRLDLP
jgi:transcriptional regulator with GAF, ATPase, and Fis domain